MLPSNTKELIEFLDNQYPQKCISLKQTMEDAQRYAGKRELVEDLITRLKISEEDGISTLMES